ncbi:hypothetical protein PM082_009857 [Marasmius tenuissimus]|nr:hypothetical protein PM082_009857 [Marasmius tenuissimus]
MIIIHILLCPPPLSGYFPTNIELSSMKEDVTKAHDLNNTKNELLSLDCILQLLCADINLVGSHQENNRINWRLYYRASEEPKWELEETVRFLGCFRLENVGQNNQARLGVAILGYEDSEKH